MFTSRDKFDELVEFIKQLPAFAKGYKYPYINHYQFRHLRFVYMIHGEGKLKALKELSVYPARSEEYYFNIAYQAIENDMSEHLAGAMFQVSPGPIKRCIQILKNDPEIKVLYHPEPFPPHIHFPVIAQCLPYVYYNKVGTDLTPTVHNELLYDTDIYNSLINKTVKAVPEEILIADEHFSQYRSLSPKMRLKALQAARNQGNESLVVPFALALSKGIALADLDASTIIEELNCCYLTNMDDNGSEQIEQNSTKLDSSNATVAPQSQSSNAAPSDNKLESSTQSKAATAIASKASTAISKDSPTAKDLAVASEHDKDNANNATSKATSANSSVATESNKGQQDNLSNNNSKGSIENSSASTSGSNHGSDLTSGDSSRDVGSDKAINNNRANGNDSGIKPSSTSQETQGNSSANNKQSSTKTTASNSTTASVSHDVSASEATADTADKGEGNAPSTVDHSSAKANNSASTNDKQKDSNESKAVSSTNVGNDSTTSNNSEAKPVAVIFQTFPGIDPVGKQAESSTNTANETIDASTTDDDLAIEQELAAQEELEALYQSDYDDIDSDIDTDNEDSDFDEMLLEDIPTNVEFTNGKPCTPIKDTTTNQESDASNEDDYGSCDSFDSAPSDATNKSDANSNECYGETAENNSDSPEAENTEPEIDNSTLDPIARANMRASKLLAKGNMNDIDQSRKHGFDSNKLHVFGIGSQELNELLANTLQNRRKGVTPNDLQALPKRFVILGGAKNNVLRAKNLSNYHVLAIFGKQDAEYCNFCDQQDAKTKAQITKQNS